MELSDGVGVERRKRLGKGERNGKFCFIKDITDKLNRQTCKQVETYNRDTKIDSGQIFIHKGRRKNKHINIQTDTHRQKQEWSDIREKEMEG